MAADLISFSGTQGANATVERLLKADEFPQQRVVARIGVAVFAAQQAVKLKFRLRRQRRGIVSQQSGFVQARARDADQTRRDGGMAGLRVGQTPPHE